MMEVRSDAMHHFFKRQSTDGVVDWAELRSLNDESRFTVHTAQEVIAAYQYGEAQ